MTVSLLRHPGFTQAGKKDAVEAIADGRRIQGAVDPGTGDGRITIGTSQALRLGELAGGAVQLAFEAIGGGQKVVCGSKPGIGAARQAIA